MVFINLTPFVPRRLFLFFAAATCLSCVSCFAQPVFFAVTSTPYDNQMIRVHAVLQGTRAARNTEISLRLINHWIENLRAIPYGFSTQWKTPAEVESGAVADCKGKAVALYEKMRSSGASNFRLVIGRRTSSSRSTHTWLEWSTSSGTYVLDPTINWMAYRIDEVGKDRYLPFYAFSGSHKFGAATATLLAKN
jgi:predicted transglutaminase-like cysteine proteinase